MKNFSRALFLVADNQDYNKGDVGNKYCHGAVLPYETELLCCIKAWRQNGGRFANLPIYVVCPTQKGISKTTQQQLHKLRASYWHEYKPETDFYKCGYWNVPLAGMMLEKSGFCKEDILVHIDLDMMLLKEPNESLLSLSKDKSALVGINEHRPTDRYPDFDGKVYPFEANTGFVVSWKNDQFYTDWYNRLNQLTRLLDQQNPPWYSIYEERVIDLMNWEEGYPLEFIEKFQVNGDVSEYTNEEILNLYFFHGHANMKERNLQYWTTYIRRLADAKRNHRNTETG